MVPAVVFIYDCSRFLFLLVLLAFFLKTGPDLRINNLPFIMYVSPNALFPLMSLFLLIRFTASRAYIPLYMVGKSLCLICAIIWLLFTLKQKHNIFSPEILWVVFVSAADLGTVMGMAATAAAAADAPVSKEAAEGGK